MTHSNDSQRPHRTRRQLTVTALVLLGGVGWAQQVSAADPNSCGFAASGRIGAGGVAALAIDPDTPTKLYAGTVCSGVLESLDGGDSWTAVNTGLKEITALAIHPETPTTVYAGTALFGVLESLDGGDSWISVIPVPGAHYVFALVIDPATPSTLYAATNDGVFRSLDGGGSWRARNSGLAGRVVNALTIAPVIPTTLYGGTFVSMSAGFWQGEGVFRSLNGASSWEASGLTSIFVNALAVAPSMPATLYAATNDGVFRSLDGGGSWSSVNSGLTATAVFALAIHPATSATLYAVTNDGVFRSLDGGGSWSAVNAGLTSTDVLTLSIDPATPTTIYAGTGAGVFRSFNEGTSWEATGLVGDAICGDGFAACGEECDDGNTSNNDACRNDCRPNGCGDGFRNPASEQCDDGNGNDFDGCTNDCTTCGDGILTPPEKCDDGNPSSNDACRNDCRFNVCGDSFPNPATEECDDGNRDDFDGCTNDCTLCGDGVVTPPEECDDGDTASGDGCDAQCRRPRVVGEGTPESCTEAEFEAALAARSVRFNCGPGPVTINLTSEKLITAGTTIDGAARITLSGGGAVPIFVVDQGTTLDVRNLTIADGRGDLGGGIINLGTLTLTNCTLRGNSARGGGGLSNMGTATLTNCTLRENSATVGGGIINFGTLTLTNCTLADNATVGDTSDGGGIANYSGTLTLTNCTLSGNSAASAGGGILNDVICSMFCPACGSVIVANSTFSANVAVAGAGAIYGRCPVSVTNSIITSSSGANCRRFESPLPSGIIDGGHNLQFPGSDCGETIQSLDPLLDPAGLKDNDGPTQTIAVLPGSPAINAGDPDVCANPPVNGLDQRGYARPGTGHTRCSIGAYEAGAVSPEPCVGDCDGTGSATIDEIITLVNIVLGNAQASACPHGVPSGADVNVALIIQAVNVALNGCGGSLAEQGCLTSGGTVTTATCCASSGDFPDTCAIGVCGCAPDASHAVRVCECGAGSCFDGSGCVRR